MLKSDIAGLTYRSKENKEPGYSGTKRVASNEEKAVIGNIISNFLGNILDKHA
tara:strand:+ start:200 stop:358 length:159 start_codon:yes stop_codon:yes gene_type:complete